MIELGELVDQLIQTGEFLWLQEQELAHKVDKMKEEGVQAIVQIQSSHLSEVVVVYVSKDGKVSPKYPLDYLKVLWWKVKACVRAKERGVCE